MLKEIFNYFVDLVTVARDTRDNTAEIKAIRQELEELSFKVELLANSQRHEIEKLALRVENELLRFEKRLPPAKSK